MIKIGSRRIFEPTLHQRHLRITPTGTTIDTKVFAIVIGKAATKGGRRRLTKASGVSHQFVPSRITITVIRERPIFTFNRDTGATVKTVRVATTFTFHFTALSVVSFGTDTVLELNVGLMKDGFSGILETGLTGTTVVTVELAFWDGTLFEFTVRTGQARWAITGILGVLGKVFLARSAVHTKRVFPGTYVVAEHGIHGLVRDANHGSPVIYGVGIQRGLCRGRETSQAEEQVRCCPDLHHHGGVGGK